MLRLAELAADAEAGLLRAIHAARAGMYAARMAATVAIASTPTNWPLWPRSQRPTVCRVGRGSLDAAGAVRRQARGARQGG